MILEKRGGCGPGFPQTQPVSLPSVQEAGRSLGAGELLRHGVCVCVCLSVSLSVWVCGSLCMCLPVPLPGSVYFSGFVALWLPCERVLCVSGSMGLCVSILALMPGLISHPHAHCRCPQKGP